jgi:hypothetical protein
MINEPRRGVRERARARLGVKRKNNCLLGGLSRVKKEQRGKK